MMGSEVNEELARAAIARWEREGRTGSIVIHLKEGKVMQVDETTVTRTGRVPIYKTD